MTFLRPIEARVPDYLVDCLRQLVAQGASADMIRVALPRIWFEVVKRAALEDMVMARHEGAETERDAFERLTKVADDTARHFAQKQADLLREEMVGKGRTVADADAAAAALRASAYLDFFELFTSELEAELDRTRH